MKYITVLIIATTFLWIQSCKIEEIDPNISGRVVEGDLNGKAWQNTNFRIGYSGKCTTNIHLGIWVNSGDGFLRESLYVSKIPLREGVFEIIAHEYSNNNCFNDPVTYPNAVDGTYDTAQDDGHIGKDTYIIFGNLKEKNKLTITKLDLTNKYIEGEFDATFLLKRDDKGNKIYKDSADTLRFKGVKFQSSIVNLM